MVLLTVQKNNSAMAYNDTEDYSADNTLIFCGTSRLPKDLINEYGSGFFTIEIEVEPVDFRVINITCTKEHFFRDKILLASLFRYEAEVGINNAIDQISTRFFGRGKKAVIASLRDLSSNYARYSKDTKVN